MVLQTQSGTGAYHFCSLSTGQTSLTQLLLTAREERKKRTTQILWKNQPSLLQNISKHLTLVLTCNKHSTQQLLLLLQYLHSSYYTFSLQAVFYAQKDLHSLWEACRSPRYVHLRQRRPQSLGAQLVANKPQPATLQLQSVGRRDLCGNPLIPVSHTVYILPTCNSAFPTKHL